MPQPKPRVTGKPITSVARTEKRSQSGRSTRSAASTSSTKSSPGDRKISTTSNQHLAAINIQKLYTRSENNEGLPLGWAETCGVTCCEELVVEPPSDAYKLKAALNVVRFHHAADVAERSTEYKAGKLNEPKEGSPKILTMVFDPTLSEMITSSWRAAAASARNIDGYGNLPTVAKLHVRWAPYLRPRGEASLPEEGMQVPLDSELCPKARLWHKDGTNITGTIISRPSMFDLYRTQNKRMRVTSHVGQLRKTSTTLVKQLIDKFFPEGLDENPADDDDRAWLRTNLRHQQTIQVGLKLAHEAGQKLDTSLQLMTTVAYRDGVLMNTACPT